MRMTSTGPAIFKLHCSQAPHKVSCPEYFACVHAHCLALCILWRFFTLLPTTTSHLALDWLGRCSSRTPCKEGRTPCSQRLESTRGRYGLRTSKTRRYLITGPPKEWGSSENPIIIGQPHHWSTPDGRSSRSTQGQSAWGEELSEDPGIHPSASAG